MMTPLDAGTVTDVDTVAPRRSSIPQLPDAARSLILDPARVGVMVIDSASTAVESAATASGVPAIVDDHGCRGGGDSDCGECSTKPIHGDSV